MNTAALCWYGMQAYLWLRYSLCLASGPASLQIDYWTSEGALTLLRGHWPFWGGIDPMVVRKPSLKPRHRGDTPIDTVVSSCDRAYQRLKYSAVKRSRVFLRCGQAAKMTVKISWPRSQLYGVNGSATPLSVLACRFCWCSCLHLSLVNVVLYMYS